MLVDKVLDVIVERECLDATIVQTDVFFFQSEQCLFDCSVTTTDRQDCRVMELRVLDRRTGYHAARSLPLHEKPIDDLLILCGVLRIGTVLIVPRPTREIRTFRMLARQGPICNTIPILIQVPLEPLHRFKVFSGKHLAPVRLIVHVPLQVRAHPVIHSDIEIGQHHYRRLQAVGKIERRNGHIETFLRVCREQQHMLRIAV